jgi:cyanophycin synthetase
MQQDDAIDLTGRKVTARLLIRRCLERQWKVIAFEAAGGLLLVQPPERAEYLKIYSSTPPQTSRAASMMADNKFITSSILGQMGLPVPAELLIDGREEPSPEKLGDFLRQYGQVVAKPLDAAHGNGVTINIESLETLQQAITQATKYASNGWVLVQQQLTGIDVRVVCINYQFANAISRMPARVIGDGQHTVDELIAITNASSDRGPNYSARLNTIPLERVYDYLDRTVLKSVPSASQSIQVLGVANIGAGGELENITTVVPPFLQQLAEQTARALDLPVAGIDFMLKRLPTLEDSEQDLTPVIIEANASPMLAMYEDLGSTEQIVLLDKYLDFVAHA